MKYLKDVRIQLAIGALFFAIGLIDAIRNNANELRDLTTIGKVGAIGVSVVIAGFFIQVAVAIIKRFGK